MTDMLSARRVLLSDLRRELVGPSPLGREVDCSAELAFDTFDAAAGPYRQQGSGEEILTGDRPFKRYGIGVLYPIGLAVEAEPATTDTEEQVLEEISQEQSVDGGADVVASAARRTRSRDAEDEDLPLSTANSLRPSSFGLSFIAGVPDDSELRVVFRGAQYVPKEVAIKERDAKRTWWLRRPFEVSAAFSASDLLARRAVLKPARLEDESPEGLAVDITAVTRPAGDGRTLLTVSAVNRSAETGVADSAAIFQASMECEMQGSDGAVVHPYEEPERAVSDEELASLALLYRDVPAFGVGHGCAADWDSDEGSPVASRVKTASLPSVEVPSTTPDILDAERNPILVPMAPLAGLNDDNDGSTSLQSIVDGYSAWIKEQEARIPGLEPDHQPTAAEHLRLCEVARDRMQDGIKFLAADEKAAEAFRLANHAMLLQQQRSGHPPRTTTFNKATLRIEVEGAFTPRATGRGSWRPFQIAFVLAALRSTAEKHERARDTVELIFFPTGGGKTEAYLGLTAFSIFYRRLANPADTGVDVLMRYTLRLLTAQQFQRASSLICAMERLRAARKTDLGAAPISIGVWLGGSVTPNYRKDALPALKQLNKEGDAAENPFVLLRCPWCSAQMGPIDATGKSRGRRRGPEPKVAGYVAREDTVIMRCPDSSCDFHSALPIWVIDEDVYEHRPSLVIGTVDKFAMLAFRPEARALFGIGPDGSRTAGPPNLIIQDELHLISGPLGSMVGLYETLIEELCTDRRGDASTRPKIVGSTATIRRYEQQIKDLYCRSETALFPPRGLDAGNSYFARYARYEDARLMPGRIYVGVHGPGLGSIQTAQVRTLATLAQSVRDLPADEQDPWWTLLVFFNSLRELGTSLSLLQSDIPDYLRVLQKRHGRKPENVRRLWKVEELTGRLRNDEVPKAIEKLEVKTTSDGPSPVDVCLASNIVEVGVDIERLSLMTVVGQPKTTAQYIQATGRIGRNWKERPGLVATIYGASKPRDRSHFEKFRAYHERLYAQVEPTSVTPFAPPVLDRALHAVLVAYVRQLSAEGASPRPVPDELVESAHDLVRARVADVDSEELARFEETFQRRVRQWKRWDYTDWLPEADSEDYALLRYAGDYADKEAQQLSWAVPTSLRNVDAECRAEITRAYIKDDEEAA